MMKTVSKPTDSACLMKKIFASLGIALAATLSLTNCTKELESPVAPVSEGIPFEVSTILTKTTNEGKSTKWAKDDAMNIFHADVDGTTYTSDGEFTVDEALTGIFSGTLATSYDAIVAHDWYAFYPYSSYNKTPAGVDKDTFGYTTIGGTTQTQTGNNSTDHLCGTVCPLYGIAKNVAAGKTPSFVMNNLTSVICVEVTNARDADLTVNSIEFTSTEDIVGTYYIDFTASPVKYTARGATYVSNTASLVVSNGEAIANGSSAKFYIAIKPHDVAANSTLKLSVNGYEKTLTVPSGVTFNAGKIKTIKYKYDPTGVIVSSIYTCGFEKTENFTATNSYQGTVTGGDTGKQWKVYYGAFSTSSKISGSNSLAMRRYSSGSNYAYAQMEFDLSKVTKVTYKAKAATSNNAKLLLNTFYSTDGGSNWIAVDVDKSLTSSASDYSFEVSETGEYDKVRIKFAISSKSAAPSKSSAQLTIDDITLVAK